MLGDASMLDMSMFNPPRPPRQMEPPLSSADDHHRKSAGATPSIRSKRTFPASSSAQSLASVGEEGQGGHVDIDAGDMSTLLPTSPDKLRHLLRNEEMLQNETMTFDGPSMLATISGLPDRMPYRSIDSIFGNTAPTPRQIAQRQSPQKARPAASGDATIDLNDLMGKVTKVKRPSGTEESFVDLLKEADSFLDG